MTGLEIPDPISAVADFLVEVFEVEAVVVEILALAPAVAELPVEVFEVEAVVVEILDPAPAVLSVEAFVRAVAVGAIFAAPDPSVPAAAVAANPV